MSQAQSAASVSARHPDIARRAEDDAGVVDVANVTDGDAVSAVSDEPAAEPPRNEQPSVEPEMAPRPPRRAWSMPKSPMTRTQAQKLGHVAVGTATSTARFIADVAQYGGRALAQCWRAIDALPAALKLFFTMGLLGLLGLAGSIALGGSLGLICTVVVVPVCSIALGALGHRLYSGVGDQRMRRADTHTAEPATSDLQRSVEYVDKKLAVALNSFGTEHHQQAVIALVQAKTAVELTLGTEQDDASYGGMSLAHDGQELRPRIRVGSSSKSPLRESNSLAAS